MTGTPGNVAGNGTPPEVSLAVLIRLVQWNLDDIAHDLPAGRATVEQRAQLAANLESLAELLRQQPTVIDSGDQPGR